MTRTIHNEDSVTIYRGNVVENKHNVHVAVVDSTSNLLYAVGNPSRMTLARSAAKPIQALAILETGAFEQFGFTDADLALMCASHSSEDRHITRARAMLAKISASEEDLRCGGHPAISEVVNRSWIKNDFIPTAVCNNCSGKHAGMLAATRVLGVDLTDYHLPDHPTQKHVKCVTEELCGLGPDGCLWGIDGCNLPAPACPLHNMAYVYASLAAAKDAFELNPSSQSNRTQHLAHIFQAMTSYPEMVGGEDRFCSILMQSFQGNVVGKVGAEGFYGVAVRESEQTRALGAEGALGISVKIEDGSLPILYAVVAEILEQLQIGTSEMRSKLASFHHLECLNTMGVVTGHVALSFQTRASTATLPMSRASLAR
jgi:L-asparaginase II